MLAGLARRQGPGEAKTAAFLFLSRALTPAMQAP